LATLERREGRKGDISTQSLARQQFGKTKFLTQNSGDIFCEFDVEPTIDRLSILPNSFYCYLIFFLRHSTKNKIIFIVPDLFGLGGFEIIFSIRTLLKFAESAVKIISLRTSEREESVLGGDSESVDL
jgi:hypothetical protein